MLRCAACLISGSSVVSWTALAGAGEQANSADAFANSMCINIHSGPLPFSNWQLYQDNWPSVINAIKDIGFRTVRDFPWDATDLNALTAQAGTKIDAIIEYRNPDLPYFQLDFSHLSDALNAAKALNGLASLEGPNEYNGSADPDWQTHLVAWQQSVYQQAKADPLLSNKPVLAPSLFRPSDLPGLANYVDAGNTHQYNYSFLPSEFIDAAYSRAVAVSGPNHVVYATEAGSYTRDPSIPGDGPIFLPESVHAKYIPRVYFEYFNRGIAQTYIYELLDQAVDPDYNDHEDHFGLLRSDFSYKPAANSVKNLFTLLSDANPSSSSFAPASLDYSITGGNTNLHHTLLQKADGTFYLALWQETQSYDPNTDTIVNVPTVPITLTLANPIPQADVYLPDSSTASVLSLSNVTQLSLNVPDEIMLVRLGLSQSSNAGMIFSSGVRTIGADSDFGLVPASPATNLTFAGGTMRLAGPGGFAINANRSVSIAAGGATIDTNGVDLTFAGAFAGTASLTKSGAGTLHLANLRYSGPVSINAGAIHILPSNRSTASTSVLFSAPAIGATGQLDLENNALIVNYGDETTHATRNAIRNLLINGRNAGPASAASWNGLGGIVSSYARANGNGFNLAVGYADNADLAAVRASGSYTSFGGQTVSSTTILVQLTLGADATLDGVVDGEDVAILGTHFQKPGSGQWCFGDFDYSGTCDGSDVAVLGTTFGKTSPALSPAQMTAEFGATFTSAFEAGQNGAVPEPSTSAMGMACLVLFQHHRRRARMKKRTRG